MNETMKSKWGERARNRDGKSNRSINTGGNRETTRKKNSEKSIVEKEERKKPGMDELKKHAILHCVVDWAGIFFPKWGRVERRVQVDSVSCLRWWFINAGCKEFQLPGLLEVYSRGSTNVGLYANAGLVWGNNITGLAACDWTCLDYWTVAVRCLTLTAFSSSTPLFRGNDADWMELCNLLHHFLQLSVRQDNQMHAFWLIALERKTENVKALDA
jgi:hypothetical protein